MIKDYQNYDLFLEFIEAFSPVGFKGIDRNYPLVQELEKMMKINNQFLVVFDMIHMKAVFTSQRSLQLLGIEPDDLSPYHYKEATHPDDLERNELGLAKLFKMAHELFVAKKGEMLISSNFRFRNITGNYSNQLAQIYLFYSGAPNETVYSININTDIEWYKKLKNDLHYYVGNDMSLFRFPDEELLTIGNIFTKREFEILKMIDLGESSKQIAEKLFVSELTINTHRRNILEKADKTHITDVIHELKEYGLL